MDDLNVPEWILACPVAAHWVEYKGEVKFAMLNYERSLKAHRPMIDLGYCATELLINNRVEKTVAYNRKKFKVKL